MQLKLLQLVLEEMEALVKQRMFQMDLRDQPGQQHPLEQMLLRMAALAAAEAVPPLALADLACCKAIAAAQQALPVQLA